VIATIIVLIVAAQIYMLVAGTRILEVARAGKVDKPTSRYRLQRVQTNEKVKLLKPFAVSGESMKDYDIHDGDTIYVKQLQSKEEKNFAGKYPVLMLAIDDMRKSESRYKLRKFVDYVSNVQEMDWASFYDDHKERLTKIEKKDFEEMCKDKVEKLSESGKPTGKDAQYILSETYEGSYQYSLHPVESLYGKVCYAA